MATKIKTFNEVIEKNNIDVVFFCDITKFDFNDLNSYLKKDENDNIPEYYAQALIHYVENKPAMDEKEFLYKAEKAGFGIIDDNGVKKIEINLQKPIALKEDFELPTKFNHLVYYTC